MQYGDLCKVQLDFFYIIAVGASELKNRGLFTYGYDKKLQTGQIVNVELRDKVCSGVVISTTRKPKFNVKKIVASYEYYLPDKSIDMLRWAIGYYPFDVGTIIKLFLPPKLSKKNNDIELPSAQIIDTEMPNLTTDQKRAIKSLASKPGISILHGDTGTGKTRVYVELAKKIIKQQKSVIILAPEISLAEQIKTYTLDKSFENIISYSSLLTPADRRKTWEGLFLSDGPHLVIGPRSALFLPIKNIGLIIIDEAHDSSYKHQQSPYYSTLQMASKLARLSGASLVYGSATPNTSDYYTAQEKKYPIFTMKERPIALKTKYQTSVQILNYRDREMFIKNRFISDLAIERIKKSVGSGFQVLILLNRRGTAQLLQCESCGWQYRCPVCDNALVYHKDSHRAVCHFCGKNCQMLNTCPDDQGPIKQLNVGTKYIEEACKTIFPNEMITRIDRDSIDRTTVQDTMEQLALGKSKILVGTQLLAKGLDLPLLDTILVLDASPKSSDYLGDEKYYQLLHQVIGRGMRGHQEVKVIIQTPNPEDKVLSWATKNNWHDFYENEIEERRIYKYPPFIQLATIRYSKKQPATAEKIANQIKDWVAKHNISAEIMGPLPTRSIKSKTNEWLIIVKAKRREDLIDITSIAPSGSHIDLEPVTTQ